MEDEVKAGKIDSLDIKTVLKELIKIAKPITRRVHYGEFEYPVIDTEPFYKGLRELGVNGLVMGDWRQSGIGVDCVSLESARYLIECFSSQKDENGYYSIKEFITYVKIREKSDRTKFEDLIPEGETIRRS